MEQKEIAFMHCIFRSRAKGFSLVELLFAVAILASSLLILVGIFPAVFSEVRQGKYILLATQIAQKRMEDALSRPFDEVSGTTSGQETLQSYVNAVPTAMTFVWSTVVTAPVADKKDILVTVYEASAPLKYTKIQTRIVRQP